MYWYVADNDFIAAKHFDAGEPDRFAFYIEDINGHRLTPIGKQKSEVK